MFNLEEENWESVGFLGFCGIQQKMFFFSAPAEGAPWDAIFGENPPIFTEMNFSSCRHYGTNYVNGPQQMRYPIPMRG